MTAGDTVTAMSKHTSTLHMTVFYTTVLITPARTTATSVKYCSMILILKPLSPSQGRLTVKITTIKAGFSQSQGQLTERPVEFVSGHTVSELHVASSVSF